ncbi:Glycerol-1-phosphate dehydrogenase [NAD(P)+] [Caulifigura coniformis]|uniref:Glycerol-1-phosphate dehydrogenase [NAD(P)+] n=1 Tax=Caulifigura coniformis TaxID=2527983 RepID=A0A517SIW9_9PLAN|nr:sn-glycerol-1-phosphate dehydrogenase [Caulifigura coniformis]QDT56067.1 Glycerol-1-phosphate dehydrogenase [NAD(P)+] [Caulifigura coniformis]
MDDDLFIERALESATETRFLLTAAGARHDSAAVFEKQFGTAPAIVITDESTFAAAGRDVVDSFHRNGHPVADPFVFGPDVYAEDRCVQQLQAALTGVEGIPVAVGSGTINDLTKLVAHRLNRPYLAVATAASMDGFTAYGASITDKGSKQTFDCPAPQAVLADLEVIAAAPPGLNASGYADLIAKIAAGADWMIADAAGIEPIRPDVWATVQSRLHHWVSSPAGIRNSDPTALRSLVAGLMMSGFAMQAARSSRPASGAEHQFSHLWDMQHHTHNGVAPSHGFKVGIGTLASIGLYDELIRRDLTSRSVDDLMQRWPTAEQLESKIRDLFEPGELAEKAVEETRAKYASRSQLREQMNRLHAAWPELKQRLQQQLIPFSRLRDMLAEAGAAFEPEQIGISRTRLRLSYEQAFYIRRRFTVLDLAMLSGEGEAAMDELFSHTGCWAAGAGRS